MEQQTIKYLRKYFLGTDFLQWKKNLQEFKRGKIMKSFFGGKNVFGNIISAAKNGRKIIFRENSGTVGIYKD